MARTMMQTAFIVINLLVSTFVFRGKCSAGKDEESDYIIFPKAFFSSNVDQIRSFIATTSLIVSEGSVKWHQSGNVSYAFITNKMTWGDAKEKCSSFGEGAHLVFIESEEENMNVSSLASQLHSRRSWWMGLTYDETEDMWKWYNKSVEYSNWENRQPKNDDNDCGVLKKQGGDNRRWNDKLCTQKNYFICEKDVVTEA